MDSDKKIILVVDDTPGNIQLLNGLLRDRYKVKAATSGKKAIVIANISPQPNLILLDVVMPEMDGHEVCEMLKKEASTKLIPIVFVSGNTSDEEIQQGMDLGAAGYLGKPVDSAELTAVIQKILVQE